MWSRQIQWWEKKTAGRHPITPLNKSELRNFHETHEHGTCKSNYRADEKTKKLSFLELHWISMSHQDISHLCFQTQERAQCTIDGDPAESRVFPEKMKREAIAGSLNRIL